MPNIIAYSRSKCSSRTYGAERALAKRLANPSRIAPTSVSTTTACRPVGAKRRQIDRLSCSGSVRVKPRFGRPSVTRIRIGTHADRRRRSLVSNRSTRSRHGPMVCAHRSARPQGRLGRLRGSRRRQQQLALRPPKRDNRHTIAVAIHVTQQGRGGRLSPAPYVDRPPSSRWSPRPGYRDAVWACDGV